MRRPALLLVLLVVAGCTKEAPKEGRQQYPGLRTIDQKPPDDGADRASILSLARGSVITHRTGESLLELSTLRAIDGDPVSTWMSPPGDLPQSVTVALAARSRIEKVGFRTDERIPVKDVRVDTSTDGVSFSPLKTATAAATLDAQWFDVEPVEATHLRYTMVDAPRPGADARLASILARGAEVEPPRPGDVEGCWTMNRTSARFDRDGARVTGTIRTGKQPMQFEGGFDGRVYRLNWVRGNDYGYLLMSISPDARKMSAFDWHEEPIALFYGESWFGNRSTCGGAPASDPETPIRFLRRTGRLSLYGIRFRDDGSIDREQSAAALQWLVRFLSKGPQVRFVAHEFRRESADANRKFAQVELDALRAELQHAGAPLEGIPFVARGSDAPRQPPVHEPMRAIYSTVDLEIR